MRKLIVALIALVVVALLASAVRSTAADADPVLADAEAQLAVCEAAVAADPADVWAAACVAAMGRVVEARKPTPTPTPTPTETVTPTPTPTETVTPAPAPSPAVAGPVLGHWRNRPGVDSGKSWTQRLTDAETQFGPFEGHWRDFLPSGNSGQLTAAHEAALATGRRLFSNWKPWSTNWAQVASGARDTVIVAAAQDWANNCDDNDECWVTFGHEPENDIPALGSTADHKAMFQRASSLFATHAPEVQVVWTMMGSESHRPLYPQLWPGEQYVDLIGHDPYIICSANPSLLATKIIDRSNWFRVSLPGAATKPVVVAEWGADLGGDLSACTSGGDRGTAQHRADAITGVRIRLADVTAAGVVELDFFDSRSNYFTTTDLTGVDAAAYKALKTATEG